MTEKESPKCIKCPKLLKKRRDIGYIEDDGKRITCWGCYQKEVRAGEWTT